jgi:hypothetical protein
MNIKDFLAIELGDRKHVKLKLAYIDISEDIEAGLLLSQIAYWHEPSKETGRTKLRVNKEGHLWIAKGREDWWEEIRLAPKRFDKASKILIDKGFIEKKTFKFNSNPTTHIRLIWENFLPAYERQINSYLEELEEKNESEPYSPIVIPKSGKRNFRNREEGTSQNGNKEMPNLGITLTKITDIDYSIDYLSENTKNLKDKTLLTKEDITNILNSFYNEMAIGRWNKEQWNGIVTRVIGEVFYYHGTELDKIENMTGFLKNWLKNICHYHDLRHSKKEATPKFDIEKIYEEHFNK